MTRYKSLSVKVDFPVDDDVLGLVNQSLLHQPEPHPYVKQHGDRVIFYFHTLDLRLLEKDVRDLTEGSLLFVPENTQKAAQLLKTIYDSVYKIRSYGIKNGKRQYVDYNAERKVQNRGRKEQSRAQYYYAQDHAFSPTNQEFPAELTNQIICGDSLDVLRLIPSNSVDLIFTSPPYNFGLEYDAQQDAQYWPHYFERLFAIFDECIRILKYGGRIVVNIQPLFSDYIPSHHIISNYFMSRKMIWKGEILWEKNNYNCKYTAWGSWRSPSNPYLKYTWEFIEVFAKGTLRKDGSAKQSDLTAEEFKKWVVAKWSIAPERNMKAFGHPAMFPEELAIRVIKLFSFVGDVVVDPFNGAGTTTLAAHKLNRRYLGIDISPEYCETARRRLNQILL